MKLIIMLSIVFFSCTSKTSTQQNVETDKQEIEKNPAIVEEPSATNTDECYWQIMQRDTFVASLAQNGNNITGKLSFNNFQKDKSSGTVRGSKDGDIIKLWYSFQSEGMQSVMELWFKKQGNALLRGIGPMANKGDTSYFSNAAVVEYSSGQKFSKVDCASIASKYK